MGYENLAYALADQAHKGQVDKAGAPYLDHLVTVATNFTCEDLRHTVSLLHDILEDTSTTVEDLLAEGFPVVVVDAVSAITKRGGESYDDYLLRVKNNAIARDVKIADLTHNSQLSRLKNPSQSDYERVKKYQNALAFLTS